MHQVIQARSEHMHVLAPPAWAHGAPFCDSTRPIANRLQRYMAPGVNGLAHHMFLHVKPPLADTPWPTNGSPVPMTTRLAPHRTMPRQSTAGAAGPGLVSPVSYMAYQQPAYARLRLTTHTCAHHTKPHKPNLEWCTRSLPAAAAAGQLQPTPPCTPPQDHRQHAARPPGRPTARPSTDAPPLGLARMHTAHRWAAGRAGVTPHPLPQSLPTSRAPLPAGAGLRAMPCCAAVCSPSSSQGAAQPRTSADLGRAHSARQRPVRWTSHTHPTRCPQS